MEENLVKKTCRELGITQKELAKMTNFTETVISRWNRGSKIPDSARNHFNLLLENIKLKKHFISEIIK